MAETLTLPARVYLDTQFCVAYLGVRDPDHQRAVEMADAISGLVSLVDYECYVSILAIDEMIWKLAGIHYDEANGVGQWRRITGRKKRAAFMELTDELASIVERFLSETWITPLPIDDAAYAMLPTVLRGHDLRPADLCHLALAWASGCGIITNDRDFHSLDEAPVEIVGY